MGMLRWAALPADEQQAILLEAEVAKPQTVGEWRGLAAKLGYSYVFIRRACDPEFAEGLRARERTLHEKRVKAGGGRPRVDQLPEPQYFGRQTDHPSLTGRVFGDPLPGRSALDQERGRRA